MDEFTNDIAHRADGAWTGRAPALLWRGPVGSAALPYRTSATNMLSVEAWVHGGPRRPETVQTLVSRWPLSETLDHWHGYDAGHCDGLRSEAYFGAVFDGRYVYFAPQHYEDRTAHGIVLRYDSHGEFSQPGSYAAYDAGATDGLSTRGYYGAAFDGRYVYFVPRQTEAGYHSRVLRYDTRGAFKDGASWQAYDVGEAHSQQGVAFDGRYLYFSPGFAGDPRREDTASARVIRFDTHAPFKSPQSWKVFDAGRASNLSLGCFDGAAFDGRYIYFVPLQSGHALRYDITGDFEDPASWQAVDAQPFGLRACVGAVFDGRFLYYVPYAHARVVRFDVQGDFTDAASWQAREVDPTNGLDTGGFDGGFFDGRYVYFVPFVGRRGNPVRGYFHSNMLRYNTAQPFQTAQSWAAVDASRTDGLATVGYNAGAFDGRFFYMAPWRDGTGQGGMHGRILRYDTAAASAVFKLNYCDYGHNGGLCAAVPGPSFVVNTLQGPVSAAAHRVLEPGWHHVVGVYSGLELTLFIDGKLVAQQAGRGQLPPSSEPVWVGQLEAGDARFVGDIHLARVWPAALDANAVAALYNDLSASS